MEITSFHNTRRNFNTKFANIKLEEFDFLILTTTQIVGPGKRFGFTNSHTSSREASPRGSAEEICITKKNGAATPILPIKSPTGHK